MSEPFSSSINRRVIHIPNFGGPLIETVDGDLIRIEYADNFQPDNESKPAGSVLVTLAGFLLTIASFATGWMGHAMLVG